VGTLTIRILRSARYFDPIKTANLFGRIARSIGPMMREQKIGDRCISGEIACRDRGQPSNRQRVPLAPSAIFRCRVAPICMYVPPDSPKQKFVVDVVEQSFDVEL
jgi:hypothetical protein